MTAVPQVQITSRDYLLSKGDPPISLNGAIAITSVLYHESKLNPGSQGYQTTETPGVLNPHGAYGIASWNGPRQQDLLNFATKCGLPVSAAETQLAFVLNEIANSYPNCWAAIRSTASYQAIIPVLVDEYENPKNKTAEIDDALAIASPLAALPLPQPAAPPQPAPTPIPQAPAVLPQVQASIQPSPQMAPSDMGAGSPVAASAAGRRGAYQQEMASYRDYLIAQKAAIGAEFDAEIAEVDAIASGASASFPSTNPLPPSAGQTATMAQGVQNMLGTSWVTSIFGTGSIAGVAATVIIDIANKQMPDAATMTALGSALSAGLGLLKAKDANVTGGTISAVTGAVGKPVSLIDKN